MDSGAIDTDQLIFKEIIELRMSQEFNRGQYDFFMKNCDVFDENVDENKFEYSDIHEEFVRVSEDIIQSKLKEKYTDEQFVAFMNSLEKNIKLYEETDLETVDFLFELVDFNKFKARMCDCKRMRNKDEVSHQDMVGQGLQPKKTALDVNEERQFYDKFNNEFLAAMDKKVWKDKLEDKQWNDNCKIVIKQRKMEDSSNVDLFRSEVKFKGVTLQDIATKLMTPPPADKKAIKQCITMDEFLSDDQSEKGCARYQEWAFPTLAKRDSMSAFYTKLDGETMFYIHKSVDHPEHPEVNGLIRMFMHQVYVARMAEEDGEPIVYLVGFDRMDFKGYVPTSLLNMGASIGIAGQFRSFMKG